jgi:quercetin dioxygenase-like cupin family protein
MSSRTIPISLALVGLLAACGASDAPAPVSPAPAKSDALTITPATASVAGPARWFTGKATVTMLFAPKGPRNFSAANVTFEPGARTAWHSHPAGQTLVVTDGTGWVRVEGEARREMHQGDVVWIPANVRHWHGATASSAMTHMAIQGQVGGKVVSWFEHVSDSQYLQSANQ